MKPICSVCATEISKENINVTTDIAKCQNCGHIDKLSSLIHEPVKVEFNPPIGSTIKIHKGLHNQVEIYYPKKGITKTTFPILIFALFWLGFVAFWTFFAAMGSTIFALFSIPFWLVGIGMLVFPINASQTKETLIINRKIIGIEKKQLFGTKYFETEIRNIKEIDLIHSNKMNLTTIQNASEMSKENTRSQFPRILAPTITTSIEKKHFFLQGTQEEKKWITTLLKHLVEKMQR